MFCSCSLWGCKGFELKIGWGQEQNISTGSLVANELNKYDIITSKQHGFRKGMSCETQLVEAIHDWTTILNKGQGQVDVILLDFSKAFDTVPHQRLLQKKLNKYGIRNHTLNWISSFLPNITHHVLGSTSNVESVLSGVPQGTDYLPMPVPYTEY